MRKKVNYLRHFAILFLAIVLFTIGILIGGNVEQMRVQNLYTQLQQQDLEYQNLITESSYIKHLISQKETGKNISCNTIETMYDSSIGNLDDSRIKLEAYINSGKVKQDEFQRLKNHYSNVQINYWMLADKIRNLCDNNMNIILYFYADDKLCPACQDQGTHLSYVKEKLKDDVLIFSFDAKKKGPIELLANRYDVQNRELPVVVINDKIYGFINNDFVFNVLCDDGLKNDDVCKKKTE